MNLKKPKFWDKKNSIFALLLFPVTLIVLIIIFFKKKFTFIKDFNIPIICVGNIYIGGTGKTPTSILLANELKELGMNPVIIRKYYKQHADEHSLIINKFNDLILKDNRIEAINEAKKNNFKTIILDDGLQDYKIKKKLSIVCFHENQLIGNGYVIPSGPLRENLKSLRNVNIVLINGKKNLNFEKKLFKINENLEIFYSYYKPLNIEEFKNKKLLALAGIANPENFFILLEKNNLEIKEKLIYPDHYEFSKTEIKKIIDMADIKKMKIIMTEKDFFKINTFGLDNINYLKVSLEIINKEKLIDKIKRIYD